MFALSNYFEILPVVIKVKETKETETRGGGEEEEEDDDDDDGGESGFS